MMENIAKKLSFLIILLIIILFVTSCSGRSNYDRGYEDAMDGKEKSILYSMSEDYRNGYDDGFERAEVEDCWEYYRHDLGKTAYELGISVWELKEKLREFDLSYD